MTAPETRWTAETEELVASRGAGSFAARDILEALADAGLLLPPGGTTRVQYGTVRPGFVAVCSKSTANKVRSVYTGPWIEVPS